VYPCIALEFEGLRPYGGDTRYVCHWQRIRPFPSETELYAEYSKAGEFVYDHPVQWVSKRTGPDLAREGTGNLKKSDGWHFRHFREPSSMSEGSIMPAYAFLIDQVLDTSSTRAKINAMRKLGVPYANGYENQANSDLAMQANGIRINLKMEGIEVPANREVIALIAYMQRLGTGISKTKITSQNNK